MCVGFNAHQLHCSHPLNPRRTRQAAHWFGRRQPCLRLAVRPAANNGEKMEIQPVTWGIAELGCFLGLEPKTVVDRLSRAPHRLPPRIKKTGQREKPRWLIVDVLAWARGDLPTVLQPCCVERPIRQSRSKNAEPARRLK